MTRPQPKPHSPPLAVSKSPPEPVATPESKPKSSVKKEGYWDRADRAEIRKIKYAIYGIETAVIIIFILNTLYEGMTLDPFYLPLGYLLFLILFLAFLVTMEGLFFKYIMIRTSRSFKKRMKLIKNFRSSAINAMGASVAIIILLLTLAFLPFVSDMLSTDKSFEMKNTDTETQSTFEAQDPLGLTYSSDIDFESDNESLELKLHVKELNNDNKDSKPEVEDLGTHSELEKPLDSPDYQVGYTENKEYNFFIINSGRNNVSGNYQIKREISKPFILNIILFALLFLITSVVWLGYLGSAGKRYKALHDEKVEILTKKYAVKPFTIEDVFLIYQNGALITHQTRRLKPMDNDILSGMLTAIKDFVRDAFRGGPGEELNELKYGKSKILIEHGEFAFLVIVLTGTPPKELRRRMKDLTTQINTQFYNELKNFTGEIKKLSPLKKLLGEKLFGFEDVGQQMDMSSDSAWNNKGVVLTKLGKYNEALECFDSALKLNPGVSNTWLNRGITLVKLEEYKEAMDCFDRSLQLDPGNEAAKRRRNKCWYKWKLLEGREAQMRGRSAGSARASGGSRPRPRQDDRDYDRQHPKMEYIGGPGALGPVDSGPKYMGGPSSGPAYSSAPASEPAPRCPNCGDALRFVDEFESWYCDPCDIYPYDD